MNPLIENRFDQLEERLLESMVVKSYDILRREVSLRSGQFRVRAELRDGGLLEMFEYVQVTSEGEIVARKYRYHWQDAEGKILRRWDNATHYPDLPHAPHHVHLPDGSVEGVAELPDGLQVLIQVEAQFTN
jgi:hypothetical protein